MRFLRVHLPLARPRIFITMSLLLCGSYWPRRDKWCARTLFSSCFWFFLQILGINSLPEISGRECAICCFLVLLCSYRNSILIPTCMYKRPTSTGHLGDSVAFITSILINIVLFLPERDKQCPDACWSPSWPLCFLLLGGMFSLVTVLVLPVSSSEGPLGFLFLMPWTYSDKTPVPGTRHLKECEKRERKQKNLKQVLWELWNNNSNYIQLWWR